MGGWFRTTLSLTTEGSHYCAQFRGHAERSQRNPRVMSAFQRVSLSRFSLRPKVLFPSIPQASTCCLTPTLQARALHSGTGPRAGGPPACPMPLLRAHSPRDSGVTDTVYKRSSP